jgi:FMN-dependent NADH-azoreductase
VRFVAIGPTVGPPDAVKAAREAAQRRLSELAAAF